MASLGKWTRRGLIGAGVVAGGALLVGVAIRPGNRARKLGPLVAEADEHLVTAWLKIAPDNTVTAIVPHAEMGQGTHTALTQMLADELDADWSLVSMMEAPAHEEYANYALGKGYLLGGVDIPRALVGTVDGAFLKIAQAMDLQITGGSTSVRATGVYGMRVAGAAARELLLRSAADAWGVPVAELGASQSYVQHAKSDRRAPYAEFAAAAGVLTPSATPRLKTPTEFTHMGKSRPRLDIPAKVDGSAQFGIDAHVDGIKYATVLKSPVFGGTVRSVDDTAALQVRGVARIVRLDDAVVAVADGYWQAQKALAKVAVEWDNDGNRSVSQASIFAQFERDMDRDAKDKDSSDDVAVGDADAILASVASAAPDRVIEADYRVPYLAHAPMEPLNATAWIHDGVCEIWTGSQNPLGCRAAVAEALQMKDADVLVHNAYLGGGFGRRSSSDYAVQAALTAKAVGAPVKLIWSREEDIRQDQYRPAILSRFRAALDEAGQPIAWSNHFVDKHEPAEAPHIPYAIANQHIHYTDSPTHVPFGPWRSVDHSQHGFFTESFIDELARAAGQDPYHYRHALLGAAPRHRKVLQAAAEAADWSRPLGENEGRGIALQSSFGSIVAQVVEVRVNGGKVDVRRVVCAVDPGFAISPDGLVAQMESGIVYGLTAALYGEISIHEGAVKQSNFHDYPMLRMADAPVIETVIVNSDAAVGGAGEPGTTAIAPALANAIFDATGTRIRELPIDKYDLNFSIEEPAEVV